MKIFIVTFYFVLFRSALFGQLLMAFDHPMVDHNRSYFGGNYDSALLKKNKVESCQQKNQTFYFDSNGRVVKSILIPYDSATQVHLFRYDAKGDLIETEITSPKYPKPIITTILKSYEDGRLMKDSSSSGYFCKHIEYYADGNLRQELWFGFDSRFGLNHRLLRGLWFGVDSAGRISRIIDREYFVPSDSTGQLRSNRTLLYNEKGQLVKEEEAVEWEEKGDKNIFCPNAGSASFYYDSSGRLVEIIRTKGPSQKIHYLDNGLIAEIETKGRNCQGTPYDWKWTYTYIYRK